MRQLRFVRISEDASQVILESLDGLDVFGVPNDTTLRDALRPASAAARTQAIAQAQTTVAQTSPGEPALSPREIQMRVRAGESPEDLADSLGVTVERIARFAAPVVAERLRITDEARRARARRTGDDSVTLVFGDAVDERFGAHGIDPTTVSWDSHRRDDGDWVIVAGWLGGQGRHTAEWVFHRSSRSVSPLDETATDLLSDRPIRPVAPPEPEPQRLGAPRLARGVVAFPPMPDAHTGPLPRVEAVFDQEAPPEGPRRLPPFLPDAADIELEFEEPPLPLGILDPSTRPGALSSLTNISRVKRDESDDDRATRARIPSWDDILLGVRRKDD